MNLVDARSSSQQSPNERLTAAMGCNEQRRSPVSRLCIYVGAVFEEDVGVLGVAVDGQVQRRSTVSIALVDAGSSRQQVLDDVTDTSQLAGYVQHGHTVIVDRRPRADDDGLLNAQPKHLCSNITNGMVG